MSVRDTSDSAESKTVGRLTVGRFGGAAGVSGIVDLGGIGLTVASSSESLITNLAFRRNSDNALVNYNIRNTTDNTGEYGSTGASTATGTFLLEKPWM